MNKIRRYTLYGAALAVAILGAACTSTVSRGVGKDGVPSEVVFPKTERSLHREGTFPNEENLRKIRPGMGKQELYQLIGPPHFREIFAAREWDYVFRFREGIEDKLCQYKVVFDSDRIARSIYWQPRECGEGFFRSEGQR